MGKGFDKIRAANATGKHLCVGLDPDFAHAREVIKGHFGFGMSDALISDGDYAYQYIGQILKRAGPYAAAFKFNFEFWCDPDYDFDLLKALKNLISTARQHFPDTAIILDRKFGDIGNTSKRSAAFAHKLGVDAVTVNPYMGMDDVTAEFLKADIDCIMLARTSNPNAHQLQTIVFNDWHMTIAECVATHSQLRGYGLVAGATNVQDLAKVRSRALLAPFLIPGVGAQGGDLEAVVAQMRNHQAPWIVNVGRGIAEASNDPSLWPDAVAEAAKTYDAALRQ